MKMNGPEHVQWAARAKLQLWGLKIVRSAFAAFESLLLTVSLRRCLHSVPANISE